MSTATIAPPVPTGHPIGFWFFFWGEFAERSSYYGMRAILSLYMTEKLGVDKADAGTFMSLFIAGCYFLPLLGGYLADNFFGKYWTIVGFSLPYLVGQYIVGIENKYVVVGALALLAMGSGVIKPNISTLLGMTYDQKRPGQDQLRSNAFSWFYLAINIGALMSQIAVPLLRTEHGYRVAFLFPAGLMAVALTVFALGKRFYAKESIQRKVVGTVGESIPDGVTVTGLPIKYKVVTQAELDADWALKLKTLESIGSLFILIMFFWAIFDQSASTWIFFADTYMDLHLFGVPVTADQLQSANALFIVTMLPLSVVLFNQLAARGVKVRATDKMITGFVLTALSMMVLGGSGFLAGKKQDAIKVVFKEGEVILPASETKLKEANPSSIDFGGVRVTGTDGTFNETNKKFQLTGGTITFTDGSAIVIDKGRIDFDKSRGAFAKSSIELAGSRESHFKKGDYAMGGDTLAIAEKNAASVKTGAKIEGPKDEETPKVSIEDTEWVPPAERVTAWWQILAFFVLTIGEILISVTGLELAFVAAPPTMKSFVTACWLVTVGMANLLINAPITRLYPLMHPGVYFMMLAGAIVVVTVIFIPLAARFNRAMAAAKIAEEEAKAREGNTEAV
ncbi:MAG: MFS transporter [Planctomycetes bacterium]|nr:MFS transporter [Planctomycetota bacterium]